MKLRHVLQGLLLLTMLVLPVACAQAADRVVLLEGFTQWNCGPCAGWNPTERTVCQGMGRDTVIAIKYHVSWPSPNNDAFYLYNTAEVAARVNFYGVSGVPDGFVDGIVDINTANGASGLRTQIRNRFNTPAFGTIELSAYPVGTTGIGFCGTVLAEMDMSAARLRVALVTDNVSYSSAPGTNGERIFDDIFRDFAPDANGWLVDALEPGEAYHFSGLLNKAAAWNTDDLTVIAFLQDVASEEILQATHVPIVAGYGMTATSDDPAQRMVAPAGEVTYTVDVANTGTMMDSYEAHLVGEFPAGWTHTIEAEGVPADPSTIFLSLDGEASTTVTVRLNPNGNPGVVNFQTTVQSENLTGCIMMKDFRLLSQPSVLLVDDDGGANYGNIDGFYREAAEAALAGQVWGWWDLQQGALDGALLGDVPMVVWFTGRCPNGQTLTADEQTLLATYLDAGGKLFLSGQGISFDIRASAFLADKLHARNIGTVPNSRTILGITDEALSDGLTLQMTGGDGADNQNRMNSILPLEGASPIWHYTGIGADTCAGVKVVTDTYALIFFPFGFESINAAATRSDVMTRVLTWLQDPQAVEPRPEAVTPQAFLLGQNYPNPFNPETVIPYTLAARSDVTLSVHDLLGREVAVLVAGAQEAGAHAVAWNGSGLASGLYFYRLEAVSGASRYHATRKLMLLK